MCIGADRFSKPCPHRTSLRTTESEPVHGAIPLPHIQPHTGTDVPYAYAIRCETRSTILTDSWSDDLGQMPTALPVSITVLSPWRGPPANGTALINPTPALRLYGAVASLVYTPAHSFNWTATNGSLLPSHCLIASGPYLSLPVTCLTAGGAYLFRLFALREDGISGSAQVR